MKINTDLKKIEEVLNRGVEEIIDRKDLQKKMQSGKQLRIKLGIDPTSPNIHIGRSIPLLKLKDFQDLGHKVVFIIGDFTGVIGDTSDKDSERPMLDQKQIKQNMKNYVAQAGKILDIKKCEIHYNSKWLGKLTYKEIGEEANQFSLAEFIARENIRRRLDAGSRVSLRELLYPLMQGHDSVAIKADVELGGTDQRFNLLAGRKMQEHFGQEPQNVLMGPILEGTDGRKMSSSWGNTINLFAEPNEMFGKVMSIADEFIIKYFTLATRFPLEKIKEMETEMKNGTNPRDIKIKLAKEIVKMYHNENLAEKAEEYFINTFKNKEIPEDIMEIKPKDLNILNVLVEAGFCSSNSDARRQISQGAIKVNSEKIESPDFILKENDILQKGKRFFVKIK
ncbi:MAG: tyrosine--tRNA ligase [Patescibacteria group bacterium]